MERRKGRRERREAKGGGEVGVEGAIIGGEDELVELEAYEALVAPEANTKRQKRTHSHSSRFGSQQWGPNLPWGSRNVSGGGGGGRDNFSLIGQHRVGSGRAARRRNKPASAVDESKL
eukprot:scaffold60477_cov50-Attheya_sp.AAC.4